ncbi:hypothetical protein ABPG74_017069 [Tetrahymena malaccensis]
MNTRHKSRQSSIKDPKIGIKQKKSVGKSNQTIQSNEKMETRSKVKSKDEILNELQIKRLFQTKSVNKKAISNNELNNLQKEDEKKAQKRKDKVEQPQQSQQKLKKTSESKKDVIKLTKKQLEVINQQKLQKKSDIDEQIKAEKVKKESNKHQTSQHNQKICKGKIDEITINSSSDEREVSDFQIPLSVYSDDEQAINIDRNSVDTNINQGQNINIMKRGRPRKNSQGIKKTYSSSQQKQKGSQKEVKSLTTSNRRTRSQNSQQLIEYKSGHTKSISNSTNKKFGKSIQKMESKEKLDSDKNSTDTQIENQKRKRARKFNLEKIENEIVQGKETDQQKTPKKRGRKPKQQDEQINRRNLKEMQQLQHDEKQQKKQSSLESLKLSLTSESFKNQPLILQKKPAKKEQRVEDKNYQKINVRPDQNFYDQAIEMLQEYSLPEEIPCRENEKQQILEFINEGLKNNGISNCLYISGVPGIGKTASFLEVIKKLQKEKKDQFTFIHINAMNLSNPENLYYILFKAIIGEPCSSKQKAIQILTEFFTSGKIPKKYNSQYGTKVDNKNKVILLDELDYLVTQDQELLYNLMEWPHHKYSKLTIIGIANTMNLPEILMNKIKSRMGGRRLVYNQYNHKQIQEIITTRLMKEEKVKEVFEDKAIEYACRKIAISSSDIRKTLKVLRKAVEICQIENFQDPDISKVTIPMIQKAYNQLYSSPILYSIQKLQFHHKLMVLSIALENKHRGIAISYLSESYTRYSNMLSNLGQKLSINQNQMKMILNQLSVLNLLQLKEKEIVKDTQLVGLNVNKNHYCHVSDIQITSNFTVDDVTNSLKEDEVYSKFSHLF